MGYNYPMENEEKAEMTMDELARMMANGFAEMRDQFATLENHIGDLDTRVMGVEKGVKGHSYKVDQLDAKLDQHRQETKDGFAAVHRVINSVAHTLADHEERLKALEGDYE